MTAEADLRASQPPVAAAGSSWQVVLAVAVTVVASCSIAMIAQKWRSAGCPRCR